MKQCSLLDHSYVSYLPLESAEDRLTKGSFLIIILLYRAISFYSPRKPRDSVFLAVSFLFLCNRKRRRSGKRRSTPLHPFHKSSSLRFSENRTSVGHRHFSFCFVAFALFSSAFMVTKSYMVASSHALLTCFFFCVKCP